MLIVHTWLGVTFVNIVQIFSYSLGEGHSHVAAIMFKIECAVRLGHTSVMSQACLWFLQKGSMFMIFVASIIILYIYSSR